MTHTIENEKQFGNESVLIDLETKKDLLKHTRTAFEVAKMITGGSVPVCLYGGTIRNLLLGMETSMSDYDFIGDFDLDEIEKSFPELVIAHWDNVATMRLKIGSTFYDFTTARDIPERLSIGDINISNLYMSEDGEVFDCFGAFESLAKKEIKMHNPEAKITSDPVRILRAFRFVAELGFTMEESTLVAIIKNAHLLKEAGNLNDDLWQIINLDSDIRTKVFRALHQYGVDRYLTFPDNVLEAINVSVLEKEIQRYPQIDEIVRMFDVETYFVGGAVRDFIWDKKINDLDFKVHLSVSEMIRILEEKGYKRSKDYHTSEGQYYVSEFEGVIGAVINGVDVHFAEITTTDLATLIREGDINFSCCVYNANTRRIENPEIIKEIQCKKLLFCDPENAKLDPIIIINTLKQISRTPDIMIPQETQEIIETSISNVVQFIRSNPNFRYRIASICGNINSEQVYSFFNEEDKNILEGFDKKKPKLHTSGRYISVTVEELSEFDRNGIIKLLRSAYGKHFDDSKVFAPHINSAVFERKNGRINSCCLNDGERMYSVAAREGTEWAAILANLAQNNYNVWGTVNHNNSKIQALCSIAGLKIETNPEIIRKILKTKTDKYRDVEIFEHDGMVVFRKKNQFDYPQILVRS